MALIDCGEPMTRREICEWVVDAFRYYKLCAIEGMWKDNSSNKTMWVSTQHAAIRSFKNRCEYLLGELESPIEHDESLSTWWISQAAGIAALPKIIKPSSSATSAFRFFDLPAELRNKIYDMVFGFPTSGLHRKRNASNFVTLSRDLDEPPDFDLWHQYMDQFQYCKADPVPSFTTGSLGTILRSLTVSRQFYKEAMPIFYAINHFYFSNVYSMHKALLSLSEQRRSHLSWVSFRYKQVSYGHEEHRCAVAAFSLLATLDNLRRLDIQIDEERWISHEGK